MKVYSPSNVAHIETTITWEFGSGNCAKCGFQKHGDPRPTPLHFSFILPPSHTPHCSHTSPLPPSPLTQKWRVKSHTKLANQIGGRALPGCCRDFVQLLKELGRPGFSDGAQVLFQLSLGHPDTCGGSHDSHMTSTCVGQLTSVSDVQHIVLLVGLDLYTHFLRRTQRWLVRQRHEPYLVQGVWRIRYQLSQEYL